MYRMLTIFMFCLAATWSVSAQTAPVPDKYEIETAADCARYNDDVLRCAEWLRTTPYDPTKSGEWLRVAGFLTRWSAGTDEVMYEISEETAPVLGADLGVEKMSLLFSAYLAGGAEYALGGGNGRDAAAVARAGGDAVIEVYRANRGTLGRCSISSSRCRLRSRAAGAVQRRATACGRRWICPRSPMRLPVRSY